MRKSKQERSGVEKSHTRQQDARFRMGRNRGIRNSKYTKHNNRKHRGNGKNSTSPPRDNYSNSNTNSNIPRNIEMTAPRNTPNWEKYSTSGINSDQNDES